MKILETNYEIKNSSVIQDKLVALQTELTALSTTVTNNNSNLQSLISSVNSSITSILNDLDQKATSIQILSTNLQSLISSIAELVESDAIKTNSVISDYGEIGELHSDSIFTNELELGEAQATSIKTTNIEATNGTFENIITNYLEITEFIINYLKTKYFESKNANIENIISDNVNTGILNVRKIIPNNIDEWKTLIGSPDNTHLTKISIPRYKGHYFFVSEGKEISLTILNSTLISFSQDYYYLYRIDFTANLIEIYLENVGDTLTYKEFFIGTDSNLSSFSELVDKSLYERNVDKQIGIFSEADILHGELTQLKIMVLNEVPEIPEKDTIYIIKNSNGKETFYYDFDNDLLLPLTTTTDDFNIRKSSFIWNENNITLTNDDLSWVRK